MHTHDELVHGYTQDQQQPVRGQVAAQEASGHALPPRPPSYASSHWGDEDGAEGGYEFKDKVGGEVGLPSGAMREGASGGVAAVGRGGLSPFTASLLSQGGAAPALGAAPRPPGCAQGLAQDSVGMYGLSSTLPLPFPFQQAAAPAAAGAAAGAAPSQPPQMRPPRAGAAHGRRPNRLPVLVVPPTCGTESVPCPLWPCVRACMRAWVRSWPWHL